MCFWTLNPLSQPADVMQRTAASMGGGHSSYSKFHTGRLASCK